MKDSSIIKRTIMKMKESFETYYPIKLNVDIFNSTLVTVDSMVFKDKDVKFSVEYDFDTIWSYVRKSSSSGLPYLKKKGDLIDVAREIVHSVANHRFDKSVFSIPSIVFSVYQSGNSGYKGRLVFCPPFAITILEYMFSIHLNDYFIESKTSSIMIGDLQKELYELMLSFKDKWKYTGDYSDYDRTIPSDIM